MAKTVDQIREQIAKLQLREKALLQKEAPGVIARIKEAVAHYGITVEQIFGSTDGDSSAGIAAAPAKTAPTRKLPPKAQRTKVLKSSRAKRAAPAEPVAVKTASPAKGVKVAPKFKDPEGNSWSGRGSQPRWLRAALESGKKLEDFTVA